MTDSSRVGTVLASKYRLDEELGRGGMGTVYRAFHLLVHKDFAVKVLSSELSEPKKIAQRFFLEAQAAGRIGHPAILDVYDVGEDDSGRPFMVMELLRGEPLAALVARGPLGVDEACWIAMEVLAALVAAHQADVVHRDVKPQNVFLVVDGGTRRVVKLLDFGIAKFLGNAGGSITHSGEIIGSPLYMAPEQAKGEADVDARVDVWSVGAMLFEMLTGKPAHAAATAVAVLARILTEVVPPPSSQRSEIPSALDAVVTRALAIDREARFATSREMHDALGRVRVALGTADTTPTFPAPPPRPAIRIGDARDAQVGVATSTVASSRPSPQRPAMDVPDTNDAKPKNGRPLAIVAVIAALAGAAGFVAYESRSTRTLATSAPLPEPTAVSPPVAASASAPVAASVSAPTAESPGPSSSTRAVPVAVPVSRPSCAAGEVLSLGHCCPHGLVWQSGRCERPLATSF